MKRSAQLVPRKALPVIRRPSVKLNPARFPPQTPPLLGINKVQPTGPKGTSSEVVPPKRFPSSAEALCLMACRAASLLTSLQAY